MKCEMAKENIILASYGELPDEYAVALELHLDGCEECRGELDAMQAMEQHLALLPVTEPSPNLLAQARVRLDEALDAIPPHGILTRLRSGLFAMDGPYAERPRAGYFAGGSGISGGKLHLSL